MRDKNPLTRLIITLQPLTFNKSFPFPPLPSLFAVLKQIKSKETKEEKFHIEPKQTGAAQVQRENYPRFQKLGRKVKASSKSFEGKARKKDAGGVGR